MFVNWNRSTDQVHVIVSLNIGFFSNVAARQLIEIRCSKLFESGTLLMEINYDMLSP